MEPASIDTIKAELKQLPPKEVLELLLRLVRFKKENKELLTYLLFESADLQGFIGQIRNELDIQFDLLKSLPSYQYRKQFRKTQRIVNKPLKYIGSKTASIELYLHMARKIDEQRKFISARSFADKMLLQYITKIDKLLPAIEEDLQYDIQQQLAKLRKQ